MIRALRMSTTPTTCDDGPTHTMNDAGAGSETAAPAPRKPPARLRRSIVSVLGSQVVVLALGVANTILATRVLGPAGRGQVVLALNIAAVVQVLCSFGLPSAVNYFVARDRGSPEAIQRAMGALCRLTPAMLSCWLVAYVVVYVARAWPVFGGLSLPTLLLSASLALLILVQNVQISLLASLHDFPSRNLLWTGMPAIVVVALVTNFLVGARLTPELVLGFNVVAGAVTGLVGTWVLRKRHGVTGRRLADAQFTREFGRYGMRFYIGMLAQILNYRLDSFVVNAFLGSAALGLYATGVSVAELLLTIPMAVNTVTYPTIASLRGAARERLALLSTGLTLYIVSGTAVVLGVLVEWLIPLAFGPAFRGSIVPARWLLPGMVSLAVVRVLTNAAAGSGHPEVYTRTTLAGVLLTIPLDLVLIPRMGVLGAALASSLAYTASGIMAVHLYAKVSGTPAYLIAGSVVSAPWSWREVTGTEREPAV